MVFEALRAQTAVSRSAKVCLRRVTSESYLSTFRRFHVVFPWIFKILQISLANGYVETMDGYEVWATSIEAPQSGVGAQTTPTPLKIIAKPLYFAQEASRKQFLDPRRSVRTLRNFRPSPPTSRYPS